MIKIKGYVKKEMNYKRKNTKQQRRKVKIEI